MSLNIRGTLLAASLFITLQIGRVVAILNLAAIFNIFESHLRGKKMSHLISIYLKFVFRFKSRLCVHFVFQ